MRVWFENRECSVGAVVLGDEVLLGAIRMEDIDSIVVPPLRRMVGESASSKFRGRIAERLSGTDRVMSKRGGTQGAEWAEWPSRWQPCFLICSDTRHGDTDTEQSVNNKSDCGRNQMKGLVRFGLVCVTLVLSGVVNSACAQDAHGVVTLVSRNDLLVRSVNTPTAAALDWAAYHANPLLVEPPPKPGHFDGQTVRPGLEDLDFPGIEPGSYTDTKPEDIGVPLVWSSVSAMLMTADRNAAATLVDVGYHAARERWGTRRRTQHLATLYVNPASTEHAWVEIRFQRGFETGEGITDNDGDGSPEVYGRTKAGAIEPVAALLREYIEKRLEPREVELRVNEIATALYDNHYVFARDVGSFEPTRDLGPEIMKALGALAGKKPVGIIERPEKTDTGHPTPGRFLLLLYSGSEGAPTTQTRRVSHSDLLAGPSAAWTPLVDRAEPVSPTRVANPGDGLAGFRSVLEAALTSEEGNARVIRGRDNTLFLRRSLEYLAAKQLDDQPMDPGAMIVAFANQLKARHVDFVFVPIPVKATVYPDWLGDVPADLTVNAAGQELFERVRAQGVRVLDLTPAFKAARVSSPEQPLYLRTDTHWTPRGAEIAAEWVAKQLVEAGLESSGGSEFAMREEEVTLLGNLTRMLAEDEREDFEPEKVKVAQVLSEGGTPLSDRVDEAPVVLLGDSYLTIYQREQCGSGGFAAHVARVLRQPVDLIAAQGGGPQTRMDLARRGADYLQRKKVVVLAMSERDLYNAFGGWKPVTLP